MPDSKPWGHARDDDRINLDYDYEVCAWARHFNASEKTIKEAVAAVGNRVGNVRQHLTRKPAGDHPSA